MVCCKSTMRTSYLPPNLFPVESSDPRTLWKPAHIVDSSPYTMGTHRLCHSDRSNTCAEKPSAATLSKIWINFTLLTRWNVSELPNLPVRSKLLTESKYSTCIISVLRYVQLYKTIKDVTCKNSSFSRVQPYLVCSSC